MAKGAQIVPWKPESLPISLSRTSSRKQPLRFLTNPFSVRSLVLTVAWLQHPCLAGKFKFSARSNVNPCTTSVQICKLRKMAALFTLLPLWLGNPPRATTSMTKIFLAVVPTAALCIGIVTWRTTARKLFLTKLILTKQSITQVKAENLQSQATSPKSKCMTRKHARDYLYWLKIKTSATLTKYSQPNSLIASPICFILVVGIETLKFGTSGRRVWPITLMVQWSAVTLWIWQTTERHCSLEVVPQEKDSRSGI